jgi:hypothetical protein
MANSETIETKPSGVKPPRAIASGVAAPNGQAGEYLSSYFSKANDTLTQTANELFQYQRNMLDGMTAGWRNGLSNRGEMSGYAGLTEQMHDQAESFVTNMRKMSDAMRDCGWKLTSLYAGAAEQASAQVRSLMPKPPAE